MKYIEVILPLPLDGLFTYAVEDVLVDKVNIGVRVSVPLGKTKTYVGVATCTPHDLSPEQMVDAKGKYSDSYDLMALTPSSVAPQRIIVYP